MKPGQYFIEICELILFLEACLPNKTIKIKESILNVQILEKQLQITQIKIKQSKQIKNQNQISVNKNKEIDRKQYQKCSKPNKACLSNHIYNSRSFNSQDEGSTLITQIKTNQKSILSAKKKFQVYMVEDSVPPTDFPQDQQFTSLPSTVQFSRIVANVINSLSTSYFKQIENQQNRQNSNENTIQKWTRYLNFIQNKALVSDCFWYSICKFFHTNKCTQSQNELEKRISKNYISLFLSIGDKKENNLFFKQYFNTLAQSVFYSFFYAFPKSRSKFDNKLKQELLTVFSKIFTGIQISNKKGYYQKWTLDLGTGNILARKAKKLQPITEATSTQSQGRKKNIINPDFRQRMKKRQTLPIRYSPIVELYLKTNKYKTRNYVSEFKMKYTQVDKNDHLKEEKFAFYKQEAKRILDWSHQQKEQQEKKRIQLQNQIKALKRQTINHHKRLDRRKAQQLERGAHQYANYLVSMLNAGITMTSLGVVRKNVP